MDMLPSDIQTMLNRYMYTAVLRQLLQSYGISLRLRYISRDEQASRIRSDVIVDSTGYRMWFHPLGDDARATPNWKPNPRDGYMRATSPLWKQAIKIE